MDSARRPKMNPNERIVGLLIVGDELMRGVRVDTNSAWLSRRLARLGLAVSYRVTVGDRAEALAEALEFLQTRVPTVIVTGGLGPTHDDITREAVAAHLGLDLVEHAPTAARIEAFYRRRNLSPPPEVFRMAQVIDGAEVFPNPVGAAPGLAVERRGRRVILLPGPPGELHAVFEQGVRPYLEARLNLAPPRTHVFRTAGLRESQVAECVRAVRDRYPRVRLSILPSPGQVDLELLAEPSLDAETWPRILAAYREALGPAVFTEDRRELEDVVGDLLIEQGRTLAVAESCTGGLLGHRVTNRPGSSAYFMRGVVAYSNQAKVDLLGVPEALIRAHGAVSEPVARAMAEGFRQRAGVDWCLAVTGIAGPTGGTPEKPVGTVHIAAAGPAGTHHEVHRFTGTREQIKWESAQAALNLLRLRLMEKG